MTKILIIRFSSIGDIVLTSPVIRCLKEQLPNSEIHYLTKDVFNPLLEYNPSISKIHTLKKDLKSTIKELKLEKFDYIIDLHKNIRSFRVKKSLGCKSYSFKKLNIQKWLLVNFKINLLPKIHIVDRYLNTIAPLKVINDNKGLDLFLPPEDPNFITKIPSSHQNGYIGFVIGGQHNTKCLPIDKLIEICRQLNQPIILLGGKDDIEKSNLIKEELGDKIFNACGKFSILESALIVKNANKIITHDTGLMHIASAFNKDIISVWGNTVPEFGMYPYLIDKTTTNLIVENKNLNCRPCSKIGFNKCPKKHFNCMNLIDVNEILNSFK